MTQLALFDRPRTFHYARVESSPGLQRLLAVLRRGRRWSTLDLQTEARVCAASTRVSELRANGFDVRCEQIGRGRFVYWLNRED